MIKDPKMTIQRHHSQIRKRYSEDINNQKEEPMNVIYDLFNVPMPSVTSKKKGSSKRNMAFSGTTEINPKKNTTSRGSCQFKKGDVVEYEEPLR